MADKEKLASVENSLVQRYNDKGFLLEDEVIDCCIDHDLDLAEIDAVCDRLLKRNIIFRDSDLNQVLDDDDDDDVYDRSHLDYDEVLNKIKFEYPSSGNLIEQVRNILPPQHKEWRTIIVQAQSGNEFAKNRLISMYLRTLLKQAYDFANTYHCDFEDCFQNAVIGMIHAVAKYDTTSPDSFVSYFPLWVRQSMYRYCNIRGTIFRFPAHYKDQMLSFINNFDGADIEIEAIAESEWKIMNDYEHNDEAGVYDLLQKNFELYFQRDVEEITNGKFDYNHLLPYLPFCDEYFGESDEDFIDRIIEKESAESLRKSLDKCLREKEKEIIIKRYGFDGGEEKTLEEVGMEYGVTRERIRQIEAKAIKKLRTHLHSGTEWL